MRGRAHTYRLINVFAEAPFSGSTVAVFSDSSGLDTRSMAAIARELNLPQSVFVFPPKDGSDSPRVRIFTPAVELPHAGLPMIATVFTLNMERRAVVGPDVTARERVVLEQDDGPVSVAVFAPVLTVRQAPPVFGSTYPERETVAAMLSLRGDQLADLPLEVASSGVPYLMVPLKNVAALAQVRIRESIWERTLQYFEAANIIVFAARGSAPGIFAHQRVFTPAFGVMEESASEASCGPVLGYMLRHGYVADPAPVSVVIRQGEELGRPSSLHATWSIRNGEMESLRVGGQCIVMGEGSIFA